MMYDEQFGLVERGTPGHRASAQVVDVDAEILALRRIKARPAYDMEGARNRLAWVWLYGESARDARRGHEQYLMGFGALAWDGEGEMPRVEILHRDGCTLHMQAQAIIPAPAQTINVNVTIGGDDER